MPPNRLTAILRCLSEAGVEFILVGGLAAVLNGAPISTFDVDVVHSRTPDNIMRILAALTSLDAVFRIQPERRLRPQATHLSGPGHLNLSTRLGPLDLLGEIGQHLSYSDLFAHSAEMKIDADLQIRVLDLETLISLKEELAGAKDVAMLSILRETMREARKTGNR